jgi:hypothetical protein
MRAEPVTEGHAAAEWWRHPLAREIALVLVVKIALIVGLWWAFFDLPDDQRVGAAQVGAHVAGTTLPASRIHEDFLQ